MVVLSFITLILATDAAAAPSVLAERQASNCSTSHKPGFYDVGPVHTIKSANQARRYAIRVPDSYAADASTPRPLILDFHGHGERDSPANQAGNSRYHDYDSGKDYLVVYPEGLPGTDGKKAWQGAKYATANDLQFVTDLLAHLEDTYCIDTTRIYASGKSNGGGFVDLLACSDEGDAFAAFAMASAALYADITPYPGGSCNKRRAILESHGTDDDVIPYEGSDDRSNGAVPTISDWVTWWGKRCDAQNAVERHITDSRGNQITLWDCQGKKSVVKHYKVPGLGHCWPSSKGENFDATTMPKHCGGEHNTLDYTARVLEFFGTWNAGNVPK